MDRLQTITPNLTLSPSTNHETFKNGRRLPGAILYSATQSQSISSQFSIHASSRSHGETTQLAKIAESFMPMRGNVDH